MAGAIAKSQSLFSSLNLKHNVTKTTSGSEIHSYISDLGPDKPILTLIHGYPQSAYEWRYVSASSSRVLPFLSVWKTFKMYPDTDMNRSFLSYTARYLFSCLSSPGMELPPP